MYKGYLVKGIRKSCKYDKTEMTYIVVYKASGQKQKTINISINLSFIR